MNTTRQNVLVGLFVLVGLLGLAGLMVLYGQGTIGMAPAPHEQQVLFPRANGVTRGTQVTIGGLKVGYVREVTFADPTLRDTGILVTVAFEQPLNLRSGVFARTAEPGLGMGRPPIEIYPGEPDGDPIAADAIIPGRIASAVESLLPKEIVDTVSQTSQEIGRAASQLQPVLNDLHQIMMRRLPAEVDSPGGPTGNLTSAIIRLDDTLKHFNEIVGDDTSRTNFREALANFNQMSRTGTEIAAELKEATRQIRSLADQGQVLATKTTGLVDTAQEALVDGKRRYDVVADNLNRNLTQLSTVLGDAQVLVQGVRNGEGSLGLVLKDDRLYESMVLTFRRLAEATTDLQVLLREWQKGKIRVSL